MDFTYGAQLKHAAPFLCFLGKIGSKALLGSIDGFRVTEIINAYLVNFFDKYLKGQPSELLDGNKKVYLEVETMGINK